jgi:hypothetical protein
MVSPSAALFSFCFTLPDLTGSPPTMRQVSLLAATAAVSLLSGCVNYDDRDVPLPDGRYLHIVTYYNKQPIGPNTEETVVFICAGPYKKHLPDCAFMKSDTSSGAGVLDLVPAAAVDGAVGLALPGPASTVINNSNRNAASAGASASARAHSSSSSAAAGQADSSIKAKQPVYVKETPTAQEHSYQPAQEHSYQPAQEHSYQPAQEHSYQPTQEHSYEPAQEHSYQPTQEHSYQPAQEHSYEPAQEHSYQPAQEHPYAPAQEHAYAPAQEHPYAEIEHPM